MTVQVVGRASSWRERHQYVHAELVSGIHREHWCLRIGAANQIVAKCEVGIVHATETRPTHVTVALRITGDFRWVLAKAEPHGFVAIVDVHMAHVL